MLERPLSPPEEEDAYRHQFLRSDAIQSSLLIAIAGLGSTGFIRNDWLLLGNTPSFFLLATARILFLLLTIFVIRTLLRSTDPRTNDRLLAAYIVAVVVVNAHVVSTRPPEYLGHNVPMLVVVNALYLAAPGPILPRMLGAICLSVISFAFSSRVPGALLGNSASIFAHGLAHLLGVPMAIRMARLQRERFTARQAEARAKEQLALEKERAEALSRAKSDFLATMSHEFRTPMNAVLGLSEVLLHSTLHPEQHESIKTIHKSAEGLLVLLNDILDHAKIDAGRLTLTPTSVDIRELAENALATIGYKATEKQLTIEFSSSAAVPRHVQGDGPRIRQILVNLVSNAIRFTDAGKVRLHIDSQSLGDLRHEIRICVEDTGIGISETNIERIFSPFEQANATILGNRGGTGLGLAISRKLALLMGGSLTATSVLGKGSTFTFIFPTQEAEPAETHIAPNVLHDSTARPLRILVAEDNRTNQRVAAMMLGQLGYAAEIVANGKIAVEKLANEFYDVVFMDRHMPELDGIEATKRIRALPGKRPYVIAMTASAFADDRSAYLDAGMDDFVAKPVRLEELRHALLRARKHNSSKTNAGEFVVQESQKEDVIPTFDRAPIEQLRALEAMALETPGFLQDLCAEFVRDSEARIGRFPDLIAAGDARTLERDAHSMKSAAASLGAFRLSATCADIEKLAHGGTVDECGPLVVRLHDEFVATKAEIEREMAKALPPVTK